MSKPSKKFRSLPSLRCGEPRFSIGCVGKWRNFKLLFLVLQPILMVRTRNIILPSPSGVDEYRGDLICNNMMVSHADVVPLSEKVEHGPVASSCPRGEFLSRTLIPWICILITSYLFSPILNSCRDFTSKEIQH